MEQINFNLSIPKKDNFDIIVCGGGIAGCAAALRLTGAGFPLPHGTHAALVNLPAAAGAANALADAADDEHNNSDDTYDVENSVSDFFENTVVAE